MLLFDSAGLYVAFFSSVSPPLNLPNSSSVTSVGGLELTISVNARTIARSQSIRINVSILNTLNETNIVSESDDWQFYGIPIAMWSPCDYGLPAKMVILKGNYSLQDLSRVADISFPYGCMEGGSVDHVIFQPDSDRVNITGIMGTSTISNRTLGPYALELNFTSSGYWDLLNLSMEVNSPILGMYGSPPAYVPFVPGVYTIGVADEWGQAVVLHFTVLAG